MPACYDLHIHTCYSDGTDTPQELLAHVMQAGITVFAICDHDTIDGVLAMLSVLEDCKQGSAHTLSKQEHHEVSVAADQKSLGQSGDCCGKNALQGLALKDEGQGSEEHIQRVPTFIPGIEVTSISEGGKHHILGLGYNPDAPSIRQLAQHMHNLRYQKYRMRIEYMEQKHGIVFAKEDLEWLESLNSVGKPHIAQVLIKMGLASSIAEASEKYINGCNPLDTRVEASQAIEAIHGAGGLAVWAHPLGGEREQRLDKGEFVRRLNILQPFGLDGLECYHSLDTAEETDLLLQVAHERGMVVSGGSDYHGATKAVGLGQLGKHSPSVPRESLTVLSKLL